MALLVRSMLSRLLKTAHRSAHRTDSSCGEPVATTAPALVRFPATRDWFCNRIQQSDRRRRATAGTTQRHPVRDVVERTGTGSSQRAGTDEPQETSACYVSRAVGTQIASEDGRKPQPPESIL